MLAAVTSPDSNEDWTLHGQTREERKDAQENYTSKKHSESFTFTLGQKLGCFIPKHTLEQVIKHKNRFWKS